MWDGQYIIPVGSKRDKSRILVLRPGVYYSQQAAPFRPVDNALTGVDTGADKGHTMFGLTMAGETKIHDRKVARDGCVARNVDLAQDFARIHSVITFALEVGIKRSERFAAEGYPDTTTRKGFVSYVRCLSTLLYAHHTTEDDLAFPYFWVKLPELPVERLISQHQQMDPLLDEIGTVLSDLAHVSESSPFLVRLNHALTAMWDLWLAHIEIEEQHLTTERICAVVGPAEQARIRRKFADYSRRLQRRMAPLSLLIPFTLYNLAQEERPGLAPKMARVVTRVLIPYVWRHRWLPMAPFLREPPER
jgi:hemerythrin-like domain-containing protein